MTGERGWRRWAKRLWFGAESPGVEGKAAPEPRPRRRTVRKVKRKKTPQPTDDADDLHAFETSLREIAVARPSISAGRLQLLNLAPTAAHFGDSWPNVVDRVYRMIERTLQRHLGPRDIFRRHRQHFYVVVFADAAGAEARARMALITDDINAQLFGDDGDLSLLELRSAVVDVDGDVVLERFDPTEALAEHMDAAEGGEAVAALQREDDAPGADPGPIGDLASDSSGANGKLKEIHKAHELVRARLQRLESRSSETEENAVEYRMLRDLEDELLRLHERMASRVPLIEQPEPASAPMRAAFKSIDQDDPYPRPATILLIEAENAFMAGDHERRSFEDAEHGLALAFSYQPVWHVDAKVIGTYFVTARFTEGEQTKAAEDAFRKRSGVDINALIDRCLLRRALLDLADTDGRPSSIIGVPVHFSTLRHMSHRRTMQYLLHGIPSWARDYLAWEVLDVPADVLRSHVEEAVSQLRPFARSILWRTSLRQPNLKTLAVTPAKWAGVHLDFAGRREDGLIDGLSDWSAAAEEGHFKTYVRGADTRSMAVAAVCAGFDRVAGAAIGSPVDTFKGVVPFHAEQMYVNLVSEVIGDVGVIGT